MPAPVQANVDDKADNINITNKLKFWKKSMAHPRGEGGYKGAEAPLKSLKI